ncbi:MAG TPA: fimbria/pilus periplasmic chaperone [Polyangiaceae bacterium]|nr:fimbria/pilus periplasmic chaperone [Polyangiaceae bacterium]
MNPVRLYLSNEKKSDSIAVRNDKAEEQRLYVSAYAWRESEEGQMQLTPTTDLVFYPSMLSLKPGETRKIRVASSRATAAVEATYRIFVEELPPEGVNSDGAIRVLTRFGIPIFLRDDRTKSAPQIAVQQKGHSLEVTLENAGAAHFIAKTVDLVAKAADGSTVFQAELKGWYVLAHSRRVYRFDIPDSACGKIDQVFVTASTDVKMARAALPLHGAACSP